MTGSLAIAQLRHHPARWLLLVLAVALALAIPVTSVATGTVVAGQTVRRTVGQLDAGRRSITVVADRSVYDKKADAQTNSFITSEFGMLSSAPTRRELMFRELTVAGSSLFLAGTDNLSSAVDLLDGRLPRTCTPSRCEVVLVGSGDESALRSATASLGIVVVGHASRTDPTLVSGSFDTSGVPLLVGDGVDKMALLDSLSLFARTYGWVTALDVDRVLRLGVTAYVERSGKVADAIATRVPSSSIDRPDADLLAQDSRAGISSRRFGLLGGSAAVLLLGFAVLAAVGLRREHGLLVAVLRRRGATIAQVRRLTALQVLYCCLFAAVVGAALGAGISALLAHAAGLPSARIAVHALVSAAPGCLLLIIGAAVVAVLVLLWPDSASRAVWQTLDLVTVGCLGAAVLAAGRGSASTSSLAGGSDPLVTGLPVLAAVTAGLLAARLWGPSARLVERGVPQRSVAGRIALLGAVRRPLRPVATTAFLTAAITSVVFAGAYRATLLGGAADQAAYQVPLDATLTDGPDALSPLAVTGSQQLGAVAPGVRTFGVVRGTGTVRTVSGAAANVPLVGVDAAALPQIRRWSATTGSDRSAASVADALRVPTPVIGPTIPGGARTIALAVDGLVPQIQLSLSLATADGREAGTDLTASGSVLSAPLPDLGPGTLRVVGIAVREEAEFATQRAHAIGEGDTDQPALAGTLDFGTVTTDGVARPWSWTGWGSPNAQVSPSAAGLRVAYRLDGPRVVVAPGGGAAAPLAVAVDPVTARSAVNGQLALSVDGQTVSARVVAVVPRLPTVSGSFVLADRPAVTTLLDRALPGTGAVDELWVAAPGAERAALDRFVSRAPYDRLTVTVRDEIQRAAVTEPVGRGARLLLALVAGLALLVAAAALVLLVAGERVDGAGEMFAWESDGVRPSVLRRMLFIRGVSVIAVALPFGLAGGLVLAVAGTRLVAVDASGDTPVPPLHTSIGVGWTALVLAAALGTALALVAVVAALALRERLPVRPDVELR